MREISARKTMALTFTFTYCVCVVGCIVLTVCKIIELPVFLALFAGFSTMTKSIVDSYYNRGDRKGETNEKNLNNGSSAVVHSNN